MTVVAVERRKIVAMVALRLQLVRNAKPGKSAKASSGTPTVVVLCKDCRRYKVDITNWIDKTKPARCGRCRSERVQTGPNRNRGVKLGNLAWQANPPLLEDDYTEESRP